MGDNRAQRVSVPRRRLCPGVASPLPALRTVPTDRDGGACWIRPGDHHAGPLPTGTICMLEILLLMLLLLLFHHRWFFSLLRGCWGKIRRFPACASFFIFFFKVEIRLHTLIPLLSPELVHSGYDRCRVFPDELRVGLFP